jgi:YafQ family addiction module toxin component
MYCLEIKPTADKKFRKLAKKDKEQLRRIRNKIQQILEDPHHFKPLKYPLDDSRRVQIGPFVLVYEIDEESQTVTVLDYEHHDTVYMR